MLQSHGSSDQSVREIVELKFYFQSRKGCLKCLMAVSFIFLILYIVQAMAFINTYSGYLSDRNKLREAQKKYPTLNK